MHASVSPKSHPTTGGEKSSNGRFFEDFELDEVIIHAAPRTITEGDTTLYHALTGNRFTLQTSNQFARNLGYNAAPIDDIFLFNMVFGLSVSDISRNAKANLGYAGCSFLAQVFVGETISARSTVIGLRETSSGDSGIVYVLTEGLNHLGTPILRFIRWVLIPKRDLNSPVKKSYVLDLPPDVYPLTIPAHILNRNWNDLSAGSPHRWEDYEAGEKIDHIDGVTVEGAEHMTATRLYRNAARVHFDGLWMQTKPDGERLVYGGHVIALARALSYNGLANACIISAINAGRHSAPVFAGDTLYAWTEVKECIALQNRSDIGALRLITSTSKDHPCASFPTSGKSLVLTLDYTVILPRR
ncbi:MAG: MaoC family dehydratase [Alphaproteobacteria bacterium]|nr:MaoC family dehydratase [Alphaproteobacteria bacterium]